MSNLTRISIAAICALGATVAIAQTVQPRGATTQARPPLQTAQAPVPAGGAATCASGATAVAGAGASTVALVVLGVVAVAAAASNGSDSTVTHTP